MGETTIPTRCADLATEILARISGSQAGTWTDPHNGGKYSLLSASDVLIRAQRVTGTGAPCCPGPYTDLTDLSLSTSGSSCVVTACSESQSQSVSDFSTNYCNQRNLYCGSNVGCKPVSGDFYFKDDVTYLSPGTDKYPGATADASMCIVEDLAVWAGPLLSVHAACSASFLSCPGSAVILAVLDNFRVFLCCLLRQCGSMTVAT